jgi:hypothetical protein
MADKRRADEASVANQQPEQSAIEMLGAAAIPFGMDPVAIASDPKAAMAGASIPLAVGASIAAPMAAVELAPAMAPSAASGALGYLTRSAALNAIAGGSAATVREGVKTLAGEQTAGEAAKAVGKEALISAALAPLNPVIEKALGASIGLAASLGNAGKEALSGAFGKAAVTAAKGAALGLMRPLYNIPKDEVAAAARESIRQSTGVDVPESMGEALGKSMFGVPYTQIESELGPKAVGAISDSTRDAIAKKVAYAATELAGSGAAMEDVAQSVIGELRTKIGGVSGPAEQEIKRAAEAVTKAVNSKLDRFGQDALDAFGFGGSVTGFQAGSAGKEIAERASMAFKDAESALYSNARAGVPKDFKVQPKDMAPLQKIADEIESTGLKKTVMEEGGVSYDTYGNPVQAPASSKEVTMASSIPDAQARGFLAQIREFSSTPQTLDSIRQFRTQVSDAISENGILSGLGSANKKRIARAAYETIENAMDRLPDPATKAAFKYANKHRFENIDTYTAGVSERAATGYEAGGTSSETLFGKLKGNVDAYSTFKKMLQGTPETPDLWPKYKETFKDAVLTDAFEAAREQLPSLSGEARVSVGKFLDNLGKTPPEILRDLGINTQSTRVLAGAEKVGEKLLGSIPKETRNVMDWVSASEGELKAFLDTGDVAILNAAKARSNAEADLFKNRAMAEAAKGMSKAIEQSPSEFLKGVLSGKYTSQETSELIGALKDNPEARAGVQRLFVEKLLADSTRKTVVGGKAVNPETLAGLIAEPTSGAIPSSGGPLQEAAAGILGKAKLNDLRNVMAELRKTQTGAFPKNAPEDVGLVEAVMGTEGELAATYQAATALGQRQPMRVLAAALRGVRGGFKYQLASKLFNNDATRPLLTKPISKMTAVEAAAIEETIRSNQ